MPKYSSTFGFTTVQQDFDRRLLPTTALNRPSCLRPFTDSASSPPDLGREIWELAVRPSECGVHFSMNDWYSLANGDQGSVYDVEPHTTGPLIAAPGFPTELSWVKDNPSTYLVDAGLWTACRESRAVMETRFRTAYWRKKRQRRRKRKSGRRPSTISMYRHEDGPGLACFRQGNEDWTCAVFPHRDLFCFRGVPAASVDVHYDLGWHSPFGSRWLGFGGLRRVAFEFDETWTFDHGKDRIKDLVGLDDPRGVFLETLDQIVESEGTSGMRLFLIDYGLRLKPGASAWQTFHGEGFHGEGCRLIDHCEEDLDWKRSAGRGAWKFLHEIENWGEAYWSRHNERVTCPGSEFSSVWVSSYITVLACERD
ncbi:hypothetical protein CMUS01_09983 [Colletotrichum musicola]|uniref:Uncharacterized protein n=1 Tax=Colletotrichum musicola TaxID=2175873 RepID=A0A8H6K5D3_9PEZI|nr:hypothetical protein CMUS01_09983 [Colletotrichum musicola]